MATAKKKTVVSKAISTTARKKVPKKKIAAKVVKKAGIAILHGAFTRATASFIINDNVL